MSQQPAVPDGPDVTHHAVDAGSVDLVRLSMQQSAVATVLLAPDGQLLRMNQAACLLFGFPLERLRMMTWQELAHPDDLVIEQANVDRVLTGAADSYRSTARYVRGDGEVVHGDITVTGIRDSSGRAMTLIAQIIDITEQRLARAEARAAQEQLRGVIDAMLDPWVLLNAVRDGEGHIIDFVYVDANAAACRENGTTRDELLGSRLLSKVPGQIRAGLFAQYAAVVDKGTPLALDDDPSPSDLPEGTMRWFDNRAVRVGDGISVTWREVTERVEQRRTLARQALQDPLTGLANRQRLMDSLAEAFSHTPRTGERIAVMFCDLDDLKQINDHYGHHAGDVVLRAVADRMASAVREEDLVARVGGDEFVVVATGVQDYDAAVRIAEKIGAAVTRPVSVLGGVIVPILSIGVTVAEPGADPHEVLRSADRELYAKKTARGRV